MPVEKEEWSVQRGVAEGARPGIIMLEGQWSQKEQYLTWSSQFWTPWTGLSSPCIDYPVMVFCNGRDLMVLS